MRRKGTPCACDCTDTCGNKVRKINGISPNPNGDFEIKAGNGIGVSSGENSITIINQAMASSFVAGNNIDITPVGDDLQISVTDDVSINNLNVAGDIIQQGAAYETHSEKIYTTNDYIYMRDGAVGGLAVGAFSGFQVEKYDGTNDGRLVIDNTGVARVGDVGDEQPLLTRAETGSLTNNHLFKWDNSGSKAIDSGIDVSEVIKKNDLFFKQGDTFTTGSSYVYYGFVENSTQIIIDIKLPKLLDRPFTLTVNTIDVYGVNGSFSQTSNPVSGVATNNQTFDSIRVIVTFTNAHTLTVARPVSGFITYTLTVL